MKKLACLLIATALPFVVAAAQDAKKDSAPKKNTISSYRITVKPGHEDAFKKAIAAHAQKYHKGDWSWRVSEVMSGPDGGQYHIVEGPFSWTSLDGRGDISPEHMKDYATNVQPHVEKTSPDLFANYQADLSTTGATQWSNKVIVRRYTIKPGHTVDAQDLLKQWKSVYEKRGFSVAVWAVAFSGEPGYAVAFRLKKGWADIDEGGPSTREVAEGLYGADGYRKMLQKTAETYSAIVDEMLEFKPELSSK